MSSNKQPGQLGVKPSLVIFLCVLGAAVLVLIGFAVLHRYQKQSRQEGVPDEAYIERNDYSQETYQRDVRLRNQQELAAMTGFGKQYPIVNITESRRDSRYLNGSSFSRN